MVLPPFYEKVNIMTNVLIPFVSGLWCFADTVRKAIKADFVLIPFVSGLWCFQGERANT